MAGEEGTGCSVRTVSMRTVRLRSSAPLVARRLPSPVLPAAIRTRQARLSAITAVRGLPCPHQPPHPASPHEREPLSYTPRHLAEKILTSRNALEGERKQVTVLFCDLANSTTMAAHLGPDHMHALLNRFFDLALDAVHRLEGTINQFLGDGFMALFGAPIAHEDHARRAVLAALALQQTLHDQHAALGEPYGVTCQFRMGLNSGLVVVGSIGDNLRMDYSAIGDTTNLAARLQQLAEPDTILLSDSTQRLVQGSIRLQALPPVQVKGKTEPLTPYQVLGTLPRRSPVVSRGERTLSQFVGTGTRAGGAGGTARTGDSRAGTGRRAGGGSWGGQIPAAVRIPAATAYPAGDLSGRAVPVLRP